jgi:kynureninase
MSAPKLDPVRSAGIVRAVAELGEGPLTEEGLIKHVYPLFSRSVQAAGDVIYLANHSLGRPPDQTAADVARAIDCWYARREAAWEDWLAEQQQFRARVAHLLGAPRVDCIVPKASAAQGLRAILNCHDVPLHVVSTRGEFGSIDHVLKTYERRGRIAVSWVQPDAGGDYDAASILEPVREGSLVVLSMVFFVTGQFLSDIDAVIAGAHARGAQVLVDLYHAAGALPLDIALLDADFAIGGCYKYLRGGPGAGFLYLHPRHLDGRLATLDSGWFAQAEPFQFTRRETPQLARGGDAFLEATPAVLPFYQARAGLDLVLALGAERLRDYALRQQLLLCERFAEEGVPVRGEASRRGNFLALPHGRAKEMSERLAASDITVDAREGFLRLCPDILNTSRELAAVAWRLGKLFREG